MADPTTSEHDASTTGPSTAGGSMIDRRDIGRAATRGLDRVLWQRISPSDRRSLVAGVRHRRPVYVTVSLPAATGLLQAGIPTVVSGEGHER